MFKPRRMMTMLSAALAIVIAGSSSAAFAIDIVTPQNRSLLNQQNGANLQMLQNRIQRQQFQQQQQNYRDQDRQQTQPSLQQQPQVPRLNCQTQITGNSYTRNCR